MSAEKVEQKVEQKGNTKNIPVVVQEGVTPI